MVGPVPSNSAHVSQSHTTLPAKQSLPEISLEREGFRLRREGFPAVTTQEFSMQHWQAKHDQLLQVLKGELPESVLNIQNRQIKLDDYRAYGLIALDHIRELANSLNGDCPTFYQVVGSLARDPAVGVPGSLALERVVRMLHGNWFSGEVGGKSFWTGSTKNLLDATTVRLGDGCGESSGMTVLEAVSSFFKARTGELVTTAEISKATGLHALTARTSALLNPAVQLLSQIGEIVRHPDHIYDGDGQGKMVAVWSDSSCRWKKPPLLNPEQTVLAHAVSPEGGWLFHLFGDTRGGGGKFSHHAVASAAKRLDERGLVRFSDEYMPDTLWRPNGDRPYARVTLTERAIDLVLPWINVAVGGQLNRDNYEKLRVNLVERLPVPLPSETIS